MAIDDKIRDKKNGHNRYKRRRSKNICIMTGKIDIYEYLTGEEILATDQSRMIDQAKFIYFSLGKALEKQRKTIKGQGGNQLAMITGIKMKYQRL